MKSKALRFRSSVLVMIMILMMMGSTLTTFAATDGSGESAEIANYVAAKGENMASSVSNKFKKYTNIDTMNAECGAEWRYFTYSTNTGTTYYAIKQSDITNVSGTISRLNKSQGITNDLDSSVLNGFDLAADTATASNLLSGFVAPISAFLGIMVVGVTVGMTIFTSCDLCYIAFPLIRDKCDEKKMTGGAGTKQGKDGTTKLLFISDDAQHAVIAADTVQSGKSPFVIYFKTRVLSYILLSIVIFILMTGNINIFATLALKLVQGILDFLDGFR